MTSNMNSILLENYVPFGLVNQQQMNQPTIVKRSTLAEASTIGRRSSMEDVHDSFICDDYLVMYVADGHNGSSCAEFIKKKLPQVFNSLIGIEQDIPTTLKILIDIINTQFLEENKTIPAHFVSGSTLSIAVIDTKQNILHIAHLGDSGIILVKKDGFSQLTTEHNWKNTIEQPRSNGKTSVILGCNLWKSVKPDSIQGHAMSLEVSRALGDPFFAPEVIAEPEIKSINLTPNDIAVVLFTDGVSKVFTDEHVSSLVRDYEVNAIDYFVSEEMVDKSGDNITAIIKML